LADAAAYMYVPKRTLCVNSTGGSTVLHEMMSLATILKAWRQIENPSRSVNAHLL